jgi:hypothetical protein
MKKILFVMAISFIAMKGTAQQKKIKDLVGHWEVIGDKDNTASLDVVDSSTIILTYNGEKKKVLDYKIDFTRSPIWFDFSTSDDSASVIAVKSLIEIVNDNMIKWQLFLDEERPPYFTSSKGESFYLRKTKNITVVTAAVASNK